MTLIVARKYPKATYTIGNLYVGRDLFCNTLEDCDRGLLKTMALSEIRGRKIYGETAIPRGEYEVDMETVSPKYSQIEWYRKLCGGKMPRLKEVPGFEGVLIHPGNTAIDTLGCILVGENKKKGMILNSRACFAKLYARMLAAHKRGEKITIKII